ncbi:GntR family transcriptional regulator [Kitasatospora sp. NPDC056731]|uniref:GIY-YIG nuclease family protein n=1 Tax=Kitasatospora sp. NPDC056731 TaxID=3155422 RepID=UPI0034328D98
MTDLAQRRTALYRLYGPDGGLLYVGITHDLEQRWEDHRYWKEWWHLVHRSAIEWFPSRASALSVERAVVATESPRFDKTHRLGRGWRDHPPVTFTDPAEPHVKRALRAAIEGERFPHGRALPCRRDLATEFTTSIPTVTRVLDELVKEGFLESTTRRSYWRRGERPAPRKPKPCQGYFDADCR